MKLCQLKERSASSCTETVGGEECTTCSWYITEEQLLNLTKGDVQKAIETYKRQVWKK